MSRAPPAPLLLALGLLLVVIGLASYVVGGGGFTTMAVLVLVGLALTAVGARRVRGARSVSRGRAAVTPMPVPDAAALAALPEEFSACPDCGFVGLRFARLFPPAQVVPRMMECGRCGFVGEPPTFTREDYAAFVRSLQGSLT